VNCARRDLSGGGGSGVPEIPTAILVLNPRQVYGKRAKHAVADLVFGKEVTLQTHGYDKYERTLGDVILPDGVNLNQELVKQGCCWKGLGAEAREERKWLWADPQPVSPWEWRKRR